MQPPQALQDLDLAGLVGEAVERAREAVEQAGGVVRAIAPGAAVTLDYRPDRVTLTVRDGVVIENHGIG